MVASGRSGADVSIDLTLRVPTLRALDEVRPDVVVNLAANTSVDGCEREPHQAFMGNVHVVENIAEWIRSRAPATHLIQISTDQVYDGPGPHPEGTVCIVNTYAFSKYAGELAAANVDATILRTNLFGRSRCAHRTTISDWIARSISAGDSITVFEDVLFSPVSLEGLAQAITLAVERRTPGLFNVGAREGMSKAEFAFALAATLELSTEGIRVGTTQDVSLVARRPSDMRMDCARFEEAFGVRMPALRDEIEAVVEEYVEHSIPRAPGT